MKNDALGDRMKLLENAEAGRRLMPCLPAFARIDGRAFHSFTRGMRRPYDERFSNLMQATTKWLIGETCAVIGYTQSDEITLAWYEPDSRSQIFFDGRIMKMTSQLAALTTVYFNLGILNYFEISEAALLYRKLPTFDARVWNVPTLEEGTNVFLWREQDAVRNSLQMAARSVYSHNECNLKDGRDLHDMLFAKGINWDNYPAFFRRGTYVRRRKVCRKMTPAEMDTLPPLHNARKNPDLEIERHEVAALELPILSKVVNRVDVLFRGAEPITSDMTGV